jgi:hypothetical protein
VKVNARAERSSSSANQIKHAAHGALDCPFFTNVLVLGDY